MKAKETVAKEMEDSKEKRVGKATTARARVARKVGVAKVTRRAVNKVAKGMVGPGTARATGRRRRRTRTTRPRAAR
jgi:hypothetical protein